MDLDPSDEEGAALVSELADIIENDCSLRIILLSRVPH
jgi:hypothetical protein